MTDKFREKAGRMRPGAQVSGLIAHNKRIRKGGGGNAGKCVGGDGNLKRQLFNYLKLLKIHTTAFITVIQKTGNLMQREVKITYRSVRVTKHGNIPVLVFFFLIFCQSTHILPLPTCCMTMLRPPGLPL